jgi:hypothetical protein
MQELIDHLIEKVGLSPEQATGTIEAVKNFVKEKFPMMGGAVDSLLGSTSSSNTGNAADPASTDPNTTTGEGGIMDKLSGILPGGMEQKAEGAFDSIKEKLGGFLG